MKRILPFLIIIMFTLSCRENVVQYQAAAINSSIIITTNPAGADIYLNGDKTFKQTPDSLSNLAPGIYPVKLRLSGYSDGDFNIELSKGEKRYITYSFNNVY